MLSGRPQNKRHRRMIEGVYVAKKREKKGFSFLVALA
jgi:hypothetical protein